MALNVATLPLILCRQVKTIKHGSVRMYIFPYLVFLIFAVPFLYTLYYIFFFLMIFLLVYIILYKA